MIKRWKIYLSLLIALTIVIVLIVKIRQGKTTKEIIEEINPVYGKIEVFISTTGTVQPQNRLEIKPSIDGRIESILVNEGDKIRKGQILAWMSSTERAALLDAARPQGEKVLKYWREAYKPTPLIAPINGEVIVRAVEPGQTVTSTTPVLVLSDRLIVKAQVDETDIGKIKLGQAAMVSLDAYPEHKVKSKVDHIAYESQVVNNVTIYEVDVLPQKIPGVFRSGMSANVKITELSKEDILLIPVEAVKRDREGSFVLFSPGPGEELVKRRVKPGISDDDNIEIISGLETTDTIIIKTQKYALPKSKSQSSPFMPSRKKKSR